MLKSQGPGTAAAMAQHIGISAMAVRQHLYALAQEGLVEASARPSGVGRPTKHWHLMDAADTFFPQGYAELTADLMNAMREAFGEAGLERIVAVRTQKQIASYGAQMDTAADLAGRLAALAAIRTREGYMAHVEAGDGGYVFAENHCPICAAARSCTGLCAAELTLFQSVLGREATVERTEHILHGARRCAYKVTPRGDRTC
jgi:predicted ArsR family transcriptional regulator